jgi:hypothetical protein
VPIPERSGTVVGDYRRQLEAKLQCQDVKQAIERLRTEHAVFRQYPTTEDLINLGRPGTLDYEQKDEVLAILLARIKRNHTLFPLLNLMLWESLVQILNIRGVADREELFSRMLFEFYHVAILYPLESRPRKIDVNLVLDTKKKLIRWWRDEVERRQARLPRRRDRRLAEWQKPIFPEDMEACLSDLAFRGVINENQLDLILEVDIHKRTSEKQWAADRGVAYATVRSWHFRAGEAIQRDVRTQRERQQQAG